MGAIQRALAVIYPHQCILCDAQVSESGTLCPSCWAETPFLGGHLCDGCATPLMGDSDGVIDHCDACLEAPRDWDKGRAAFAYAGAGRRMVLGLKHADRLDLIQPAASWMLRAGYDLLSPAALFVPVPIHWSRRIRRRYNQSAELARALNRLSGCGTVPDALIRTRATVLQDDLDSTARHQNQSGSIEVNPARRAYLRHRSIVLVDDVMTTGATLSAASVALKNAGVSEISCLVLARTIRNP